MAPCCLFASLNLTLRFVESLLLQLCLLVLVLCLSPVMSQAAASVSLSVHRGNPTKSPCRKHGLEHGTVQRMPVVRSYVIPWDCRALPCPPAVQSCGCMRCSSPVPESLFQSSSRLELDRKNTSKPKHVHHCHCTCAHYTATRVQRDFQYNWKVDKGRSTQRV